MDNPKDIKTLMGFMSHAGGLLALLATSTVTAQESAKGTNDPVKKELEA